MSDDPQPSGIAAALVQQLEAEAELVDAGRFTLDFVAAREKLANYRQADPHAFVLLLVEAAHLLPGCSEITFSLTDHQTHVELVGARSSAQELRTLFDALFVDLPDSLGRQRLARAIDGVLAQPGATIELRAISADHREVVVNFTAAGQTLEERESEADALPTIALVFSRPESDDAPAKQRALLAARARYAGLPVLVDGERVELEAGLEDVAAPTEVVTSAGTVVGQAGWSLARVETVAIAILVAHGVIVEELREPGWQQGFIALVDVGDLRRDLSLTKLLRDEAFAARVEAIRAVHDTLPANPTTEVIHAFPESDQGTGRIVFISGLVMLLMGIGVVAVGLVMLILSIFLVPMGAWIMWLAISAWREDAARRRGIPAVGMVESVQVGRSNSERPRDMLILSLRVSIADRKPFLASVSCAPGPGHATEQFKRGACFHMRVDANNQTRVWLDLIRF